MSGRGIVIKEGLTSQDVLNEFKILEVVNLKHLEEHSVQVAFEESRIDELAQKLKPVTKPAWYQALWNDEKVLIVFNDKIFSHRHPKGSV